MTQSRFTSIDGGPSGSAQGDIHGSQRDFHSDMLPSDIHGGQ